MLTEDAVMHGNALGLSALIKTRKLSVMEALGSYIDIIEKNDSKYNAFLTVSKEKALTRAKEVQSRIDFTKRFRQERSNDYRSQDG